MRFNTMLFNAVEKCNIRCRHCGYADSRRRGQIAPHHLADWVTQAVDYGIGQITFSGGEVFMDFELLRRGVEAVHRAGGHSGVFTNGAWGTSQEDALKILRRLPGLNHLHLSCDVYHLEWVPVERLHNIIRASRRLEDPPVVVINICYTNEQDRQSVTSLFDAWADDLLFHYQGVIPSEYVELKVDDVLEDTKTLESLDFGHTCYLHTPTVHASGILWTCHIGTCDAHPFPDYRESPYFLGDLKAEPLCDIFQRAEDNGVYQMMRCFGPRKLAEAALETPSRREVEGVGFTSDCDMCYQVLPRAPVMQRLEDLSRNPQVASQLVLHRILGLGDEL